MSEQGWQAFLAADELQDWVVVHGGAVAVYRVDSLQEATRLAGAVAVGVPDAADALLLTVTHDRLSVRLTRGVFRLEAHHVALARAVSAVAHAHGAPADRAAVQEVQLAVAARPREQDPGFWRAVLGHHAPGGDNGVDPLGHGSSVWLQDLDPDDPVRHGMHVDVTLAREHVEARLAAALAAGGRVVDDSHAPRWWVLSDRAGNRVCVAGWPDGAGGPLA